jgi:hypothetical protein
VLDLLLHLTPREQIIKFFVKYTKNKLNKNCTRRNFYVTRNSEYVYDLIESYFDKLHPLHHATLAQKYYHIYNYQANLSSEKFINFKKGYAGSKHIRIPVNSSNVKLLHVETFYDFERTRLMAKAEMFSKSNTLKPSFNDLNCIKDKKMVASIFHHTSADVDLPFVHRLKMLIDFVDYRECICKICSAAPVRHFQYKLFDTCSSPKCVHTNLSNIAKQRGMHHAVQSTNARKKRSLSLKGRIFTPEHKQKISESAKKRWTAEFKEKDKQMRIDKGVYKKQSDTIKQKIKDGIFTPKSSNRNYSRRRCNAITGCAYRSSWEEVYHMLYPHLLFEHTRIEYVYNDCKHVYIVDFTDAESKTLIEIKPESLTHDSKYLAKKLAAEQWCANNGYTFKVITEKEINFYEKQF